MVVLICCPMIKKDNLKQEVLLLRKKGLTYSEILSRVSVAKSTLSLWLREVGLAKKQKQLISEKRIAGRLRALESIRKNKIKRIRDIKDQAMTEVPSLIKDPFWLVGTILYWGEGSKEHATSCPMKFTNMDLSMHKIFLKWIHKYLLVTNENLLFELFIHEKADIERAKKYWMQNLVFTRDRLRVYFKKHNPKTKRKRVGEDYNGVLSIVVYKSIPSNRKIAGWVDGVVAYLNQNM